MARGTSSYYPDHLTYPSLSPSPQSHQHYTQDVPTDPLQGMHDDQGHQSATTLTKHCSVRGCTAALPPDYNLKMCEACRGRHRVYATTKRAKRKMEKAALGGQGGHVVWMPPDAEDHSQSIPSSSQRQDISTSPEVRIVVQDITAFTLNSFFYFSVIPASAADSYPLFVPHYTMGLQCDRSKAIRSAFQFRAGGCFDFTSPSSSTS